MKLVLISDTHNKHRELGELPKGDVLIHAGDVSMGGTFGEVSTFASWFINQPHKYKILIAGNHDFLFKEDHNFAKHFFDIASGNVFYLENEGCEIEGVKFWGTPMNVSPSPWVFNENLEKQAKLIPNRVDILISHGPAFGILDELAQQWGKDAGKHCGSQELLERLKHIVFKKHIFGHIHEGYGVQGDHLNVAVLDENYKMKNKPVVIEI